MIDHGKDAETDLPTWRQAEIARGYIRSPRDEGPHELLERNQEIVRLRLSGMTLENVGVKFGLGRESVRKIMLKYGRLVARGKLQKMQTTHSAANGRVIDMGGADGILHEWTPEMQAREFGLMHGIARAVQRGVEAGMSAFDEATIPQA